MQVAEQRGMRYYEYRQTCPYIKIGHKEVDLLQKAGHDSPCTKKIGLRNRGASSVEFASGGLFCANATLLHAARANASA